ncbi:uncharacterized protein TRAVEDRAFT_75300 [Trametes versicolor FP-101664 SS1]|uniref:uncharacterized protein n=1 Tax=Trametes versicolor (strain FP-101664) TaxID=717944 RepID=UPI0004624818|nr:uncharacterized protein TRAVEDRAFT_75300 [Trametes versicolor FP-101664 SS1]EIW52256.1 hypothetical protein TRAVEDRAFT_75300 [Trametes versicolor FP-101664 SS1]
MISTSLLIASALSALVLGAPTPYNFNLPESRTDISACFSIIGLALPDPLVQLNSRALAESLNDVSTPSSASYGKRLSKEVEQLANSSSYSGGSVLVSVDIANASIPSLYADAKGAALLDGWVAASVSFSDANDSELLRANFSVFERDESGLHAIRARSYSIPAELGDHLDLVHPTISFTTPSPHLISVRDSNDAGSLEGSLDRLSLLLKAYVPPQVLTNSYSQNEDTLSPKLAARLCRMYTQLTARGTSIIVSPSNSAVFRGSRSANYNNLVPPLPSIIWSFVTSVRPTQGPDPDPVTAGPSSVGGFSHVLPHPSWQAPAIPIYLSVLGATHPGASNRLGHALPDVADCAVVVDGKTLRVDDAGATFMAVIAVLTTALARREDARLGS